MTQLPSVTMLQQSTYRTRDFSLNLEAQPYSAPEHTVGLSFYWWLIRNAWWKIALTVVLITGGALALCYVLKPVYESTVHIAIDLKTPSTVVGDPVTSTSSTDADQFFNTELKVIQSDTVLRPVVKRFDLAQPIPSGALPAGMHVEDAPVSLKNLSVTHPTSSYLIDIAYRSPDTVQAAAVANAIAQSYIVNGREMRARAALDESAFMEKQISALKENMDASVSALAYYEKQLGVIDPEEKTSILTARLQQLNTEYTEAQNDRVRKQVDYKAIESGSTAAIEVSPQAVALAHMEENVHSAQQKMESVKTIYGTNNAEYKKAAGELAELTRQLNAGQVQVGKRIEVEFNESSKREQLLHMSLLATKGQVDALNASSVHYQELKREAEANKNLYAELYRKVKEAGINGAFQNNAIRITDMARPQLHPIFPNKTIFVALAFLFSLVLSIVAVLLADLSDKSLRDPDQTQRVLGLDVLGLLPQVAKHTELSPLNCSRSSAVLAKLNAPDKWFSSVSFYEEAARALLSTILLSPMKRPLRSLMVTSAVQGEGKSCCVAHLAAMHAMQGYRTLLIDADLRCPTQHRNFKMEQTFGLADAITDRLSLTALRRSVPGNPLLDIITAGKDSSMACDQVGRAVEQLLKAAYKEYDLVFIDAPPMLCFAEPIQLASLADGVLVVCRAGDTSRQAVSGVLNALRRMGKTLGLVLNQVHPRLSQNYGPYQSYYRHMNQIAKSA